MRATTIHVEHLRILEFVTSHLSVGSWLTISWFSTLAVQGSCNFFEIANWPKGTWCFIHPFFAGEYGTPAINHLVYNRVVYNCSWVQYWIWNGESWMMNECSWSWWMMNNKSWRSMMTGDDEEEDEGEEDNEIHLKGNSQTFFDKLWEDLTKLQALIVHRFDGISNPVPPTSLRSMQMTQWQWRIFGWQEISVFSPSCTLTTRGRSEIENWINQFSSEKNWLFGVYRELYHLVISGLS